MRPKHLFLLPALLLLACGGSDGAKAPAAPADSTRTTAPAANALDTAVVTNGHAKVRSPDGRLLMEGDMKDGKRSGVWTSYTPQGRVKSRNEYSEGVLEGLSTVFRDNGALYYQGQHRNGKQVGEWKFYDEQGNLAKKVEYDTLGNIVRQP